MNEIRLPSSLGGVAPHAHRHHRLQLRRRLAATLEEATHPAGGDRQHDVVDRRVEAALDLLEICQGTVGVREVAARGDRLVEPRLRGGRPERVGQGADALQPVAGIADQPLGMPHQPERPAGHVDQLAGAVDQSVDEQLRRRRRPGGPPAVAVGGGRLGGGIEEERGQLDGGDAVDHRVVDLPDHADAAIRQPVGDPQLPQRPVAIERRGHHLVRELVEVRGRAVAHVVRDVEAVVVDPHRVVHRQGHGGQLLPVPGRAAHPAGDVIAQLLEGRAGAVARFREQRRPAHVHVSRLALHLEERGVQSRQSLMGHELLLPGPLLMSVAGTGRAKRLPPARTGCPRSRGRRRSARRGG